MKRDFYRSYADEPHISRRKQILEKYPEIENLFGPDPRPIPFVVALVVGQLTISYYQQFWSWPVFIIVAYVIGGTASQALLLMAHELSHNLVFQSVRMNDFFGIFCNIGNGFPSATMFKRYHMEHHQFQGKLERFSAPSDNYILLKDIEDDSLQSLFSGDVHKDTDIPTVSEGLYFTSAFLKIMWLISQSIFYAIRPTLMRPKEFRRIDVANVLIIIMTNSACVYFFGPRSVVYILGSSILGINKFLSIFISVKIIFVFLYPRTHHRNY